MVRFFSLLVLLPLRFLARVVLIVGIHGGPFYSIILPSFIRVVIISPFFISSSVLLSWCPELCDMHVVV